MLINMHFDWLTFFCGNGADASLLLLTKLVYVNILVTWAENG